jgi:ATP-binding cassette subfamily B protein IrtA
MTATPDQEASTVEPAPVDAAPEMTYTSGIAGLLAFAGPARRRFALSGALAAVAAAAVVARFTVLGISSSISHTAAYQLLYGIRMGIAEHLARVPLGDVTSRRSGQIKKVMGEDVERLELFLAHGLPDLVAAAVTLVAVPVWLVAVDWRMGLAAVAVVVPAAACMALGMRRSGSYMPENHRTLGDMNAAVVELVRGMPVVKVFNRGSDRVRGAR